MAAQGLLNTRSPCQGKTAWLRGVTLTLDATSVGPGSKTSHLKGQGRRLFPTWPRLLHQEVWWLFLQQDSKTPWQQGRLPPEICPSQDHPSPPNNNCVLQAGGVGNTWQRDGLRIDQMEPHHTSCFAAQSVPHHSAK